MKLEKITLMKKWCVGSFKMKVWFHKQVEQSWSKSKKVNTYIPFSALTSPLPTLNKGGKNMIRIINQITRKVLRLGQKSYIMYKLSGTWQVIYYNKSSTTFNILFFKGG